MTTTKVEPAPPVQAATLLPKHAHRRKAASFAFGMLTKASANTPQIANDAAFLRAMVWRAMGWGFELDESSTFDVVTGLTVPESFV